MTGVLIVFVADVLGHIEISFEIRSSIDDPGSGQCAGILDGDLHFHVPVVEAMERLRQVHVLGVRRAGEIVPGFFEEANGVDTRVSPSQWARESP